MAFNKSFFKSQRLLIFKKYVGIMRHDSTVCPKLKHNNFIFFQLFSRLRENKYLGILKNELRNAINNGLYEAHFDYQPTL